MKTITVLALAVLATACSLNRDPANMTDPEIAMVMRVANLGEVREGNIAREKATDTTVREFATMMVNEHTDANIKTEEQLAKKEIPSDDSPLSRQIDAGSAAAADTLRASATGAAFDRAYMDRQIEVHQYVLTTIDKTLLPAAHEKVLRQALNDMRATVTKHLDRARTIRAALK
jgi:putative membrane protein